MKLNSAASMPIIATLPLVPLFINLKSSDFYRLPGRGGSRHGFQPHGIVCGGGEIGRESGGRAQGVNESGQGRMNAVPQHRTVPPERAVADRGDVAATAGSRKRRLTIPQRVNRHIWIVQAQ